MFGKSPYHSHSYKIFFFASEILAQLGPVTQHRAIPSPGIRCYVKLLTSLFSEEQNETAYNWEMNYYVVPCL
jgi:hypothetical protein